LPIKEIPGDDKNLDDILSGVAKTGKDSNSPYNNIAQAVLELDKKIRSAPDACCPTEVKY